MADDIIYDGQWIPLQGADSPIRFDTGEPPAPPPASTRPTVGQLWPRGM
jgi:hypothetical protein